MKNTKPPALFLITFVDRCPVNEITDHDGHSDSIMVRWLGDTFYAQKSEFDNWYVFVENDDYKRYGMVWNASYKWLKTIEEIK